MLIVYDTPEALENLLQALDTFGRDVRDLYRDRLELDKKRATGKLIDTLDYSVANTVQGLEYAVYLRMEDYWKYVEKGLRGNKQSKNTSSPFVACNDWRRIYPFILKWVRDKKLGSLPTEKSLAAMISRSISDKGIAAGNQLAEVVDSVKGYSLPQIESALEKDFESFDVEIMDFINNLQI
jgi:hypothetical protein